MNYGSVLTGSAALLVLVSGGLGGSFQPRSGLPATHYTTTTASLRRDHGVSNRSASISAPQVLMLDGAGPSIWLMERSGPHVTLWSRQGNRPWHQLSWPSSLLPDQVVRTSPRNAWIVAQDNQILDTYDGGHTWHTMPLPPLLAQHRKWPQGLTIAPAPDGSLALLAWGPEATTQSSKLLWYRPPHSTRWQLKARSGPGLFKYYTPWWPTTIQPTLPVPGDPISLQMVTNSWGYFTEDVAGGPFLWRMTTQGRLRPQPIRGLKDWAMGVGAMAWNGSTGWVLSGITPTTSLVARISGTHSTLVSSPHPLSLANGAAISATSATAATIAAQSHKVWTLFNTRNGGQSWSWVPLPDISAHGYAPWVYGHGNTVWLAFGPYLYEGPATRDAGWHRVALPTP